jgi:hypothetical protein
LAKGHVFRGYLGAGGFGHKQSLRMGAWPRHGIAA